MRLLVGFFSYIRIHLSGIGINISNPHPSSVNEILREWNEKMPSIALEIVLAKFFSKFEESCHLFLDQGFHPFQQRYYSNWLHTNQAVKVHKNALSESDRSNHEDLLDLRILGLTSEGFLSAIDQNGRMFALQPDGNSFDIMNGLILQKI
jgi:biotin--protein ligase